jgi:hypothetical protein
VAVGTDISVSSSPEATLTLSRRFVRDSGRDGSAGSQPSALAADPYHYAQASSDPIPLPVNEIRRLLNTFGITTAARTWPRRRRDSVAGSVVTTDVDPCCWTGR